MKTEVIGWLTGSDWQELKTCLSLRGFSQKASIAGCEWKTTYCMDRALWWLAETSGGGRMIMTIEVQLH
jgi:hypothetical protein